MAQAKKEVTLVLIESNGLRVFRLKPDEVERLLVLKYGDKLAAVNVEKMKKRNRQRSISAAYYQRPDKVKADI